MVEIDEDGLDFIVTTESDLQTALSSNNNFSSMEDLEILRGLLPDGKILIRKNSDSEYWKRKQRLEALSSEVSCLQQELGIFKEEEVNIELRNHMEQIHSYNEIKDLGQRLLGILAEKMSVPVKVLYKEFNLPLEED